MSALGSFWNSPDELSTALRWVTIVGIVVTALFATAAYFINDRISTLQAIKVTDQATKLQQQNEIVQKQSAELKNQQSTIGTQTKQIARQTEEMGRLHQEAQLLQQKSVDAQRGVSDTYDFNGGHRQTMGGGTTEVSVGVELRVFQDIMKLYGAKDWKALKTACDAQAPKTPNWLTPYLFAGIADANMGLFDEAKDRLEYVVDRAGNDPNYADAARLLAELMSTQGKKVIPESPISAANPGTHGPDRVWTTDPV